MAGGHPIRTAAPTDPLVALGPLALLVLLYLNSGALWSDNNLLALRWARELYLGALVVYALVAVLPRMAARGRATTVEVAVLALAFLPPLVSAVNARVGFGQPLVYGLIEARRFLGYLVFFPAVDLMRRARVPERRVLVLIVAVAALCYLNSVFLAVPDVDDPNRPDRVRIGTYYIVLAYLWAVVRWRGARVGGVFALLALVFGAYLVVFAQTRQLIVGAGLVTLGLLVTRPRHLATFAVLGASVWGAAAAGLWAGAAWADRYAYLFGRVVDAGLMGSGVRARTAGFILGDLRDGFLWGHGALSLLWRGGFHRIYGDHFYLSDVGVLGGAYQFGAPLALALVVFVHVAVWRALRHTRDDGVRHVGRAYVAFSALISLFIPTVAFHGVYLGLLWAVAEAGRTARSRMPAGARLRALGSAPGEIG